MRASHQGEQSKQLGLYLSRLYGTNNSPTFRGPGSAVLAGSYRPASREASLGAGRSQPWRPRREMFFLGVIAVFYVMYCAPEFAPCATFSISAPVCSRQYEATRSQRRSLDPG